MRIAHAFPLMLAMALFLQGCASTRSVEPVATPAGKEHGSTLRARLVEAARAQIGRPYRYGGDHPREGFDCSGLVYWSHARIGIEVPRTARQQLGEARPVSRHRLRPGDLLFFSVTGKPDHVAIYLGDGEFIHAPSSGKRVSTARLDNPWWRRRLVAIRSFLP